MERMERTEMRWTRMAAICAVALLAFFVGMRQVDRHTAELRVQEETLTGQLSSLKRQREELMEDTEQVGTESYIISRARTDYQYVKPGELRFEIINPGALYAATDTAQASSADTTPSDNAP